MEAAFKKEFSLFNVSSELQNYFKEFPAVKCNFENTLITNGANALLNQKIGVVETDEPLMVFLKTME